MNPAPIRKIIESWACAVQTRDIEGVLRHHAADLLMFDVVGALRVQGIDAYRATWTEEFFPWHGGTGHFELSGLKISAGAEVAFATALIECAGTEKGRRVAFTLRLTLGLEKRGGQWLVVHEHHSEPLSRD